jgi:hypothetical protein
MYTISGAGAVRAAIPGPDLAGWFPGFRGISDRIGAIGVSSREQGAPKLSELPIQPASLSINGRKRRRLTSRRLPLLSKTSP